jgi:hypothetical protein
MLLALGRQASVDGGRRHARQQCGGVIVDVQLLEATQSVHQLTEHRRQPLAGGHA